MIDSKHYSLVKSRYGADKSKPGDYFSDMFLENNQNRSAGNTESIWVMQFQYDPTKSVEGLSVSSANGTSEPSRTVPIRQRSVEICNTS